MFEENRGPKPSGIGIGRQPGDSLRQETEADHEASRALGVVGIVNSMIVARLETKLLPELRAGLLTDLQTLLADMRTGLLADVRAEVRAKLQTEPEPEREVEEAVGKSHPTRPARGLGKVTGPAVDALITMLLDKTTPMPKTEPGLAKRLVDVAYKRDPSSAPSATTQPVKDIA